MDEGIVGGMPMIDYQDIFGRQLKRAMEIREVDIKEVSKRTGIPAKTLYFYWRGDRAPSYHNLIAIGKALHVSLDWLCGMRVKEDENA